MDRPSRKNLPAAWKLWLVGLLCGLVVFSLSFDFIIRPITEIISPRPKLLEYAALEVNGRPMRLMPGQVAVVRPMDHIKLTGVNPGLQSDPDLTVEGDGFDASGLLRGGRVVDLLPVMESNRTFRLSFLRSLESLGWVGLKPTVLPVDLMLIAAQRRDKEKLELIKSLTEGPGEENTLLLSQALGLALRLNMTGLAADTLEAKLELVFSADELDTLAGMRQSLGETKAEAEALTLLVKIRPEGGAVAQRMLDAAEKLSDRGLKVAALKKLAQGSGGVRSAEALKKLGYTYVQAGDWKSAVEAYSQAAKLDPNDANIQRNLVVIFGKLKNEKSRRAALKRLVRLAPDDVDSLRDLARTAPEDEKLAAWREVLKLKPSDEQALIQSIKILADQPPSAELAELYTRLGRLRPKDAVIKFNLGLTLAGLDRLEAAEEVLQEAHRLKPKDPDPLWALFDIQKRAGRLDEAVVTADKLSRLEPKNIDLYRYIYKNLAAGGKRERIGELLKRALKALPDSVELWKLSALNRLALKDSAGAAQAMARVVELAPKDVTNRLSLARLYESLDKGREALKQYQAVLKLEPDNAEAGPAYLRLKMSLLKTKKN